MVAFGTEIPFLSVAKRTKTPDLRCTATFPTTVERLFCILNFGMPLPGSLLFGFHNCRDDYAAFFVMTERLEGLNDNC